VGVAESIYNAIEQQAEDRLSARLGASIAGEACLRKLWLSFRWAERERFDGRMLRLFRRGHLEETQLVNDMRAAGFTVKDIHPQTGQQMEVTGANGHAVMKMDAIARGLPGHSGWVMCEFKTSNDKAFKEIEKKGVEAAKPLHFAQMQLGMLWSVPNQMTRALYVCVKKSDDSLYVEEVPLDLDKARDLEARVAHVIEAAEPPDRIAGDPSDFRCRWCLFRPLCFEDESLPRVNCRTCCHSTPVEGAAWECERKQKRLTLDDQIAGCSDHRYIPAMLPAYWSLIDASAEENEVTYRLPDGREFKNGKHAPSSYSSEELRAMSGNMATVGDPDVDALRMQFDAKIEKPSNRPTHEPFFDDPIPF